MGDVHDPMPDSMAVAGKSTSFKAEVGQVNKVSVTGFGRKDKSEIIICKKKAVNIAVGAAKKMIGFIQLNGSPTLRAFLLYRKTHEQPNPDKPAIGGQAGKVPKVLEKNQADSSFRAR